MQGYIYYMANPSFGAEVFKVGRSRNPFLRAKSLSKSTPYDYALKGAFLVSDMVVAEREVFNLLQKNIVRGEFVRCKESDVKAVLEIIQSRFSVTCGCQESLSEEDEIDIERDWLSMPGQLIDAN